MEEKGETRSRTEIEDRKRHQSAGRKRKDRNRGRGTDEWKLGGGSEWEGGRCGTNKQINKSIQASSTLLPASRVESADLFDQLCL